MQNGRDEYKTMSWIDVYYRCNYILTTLKSSVVYYITACTSSCITNHHKESIACKWRETRLCVVSNGG